jgi:hypothetical protein
MWIKNPSFMWISIFGLSSTLYIKEEKENTSTSNIEKNYYRVDKKTTS